MRKASQNRALLARILWVALICAPSIAFAEAGQVLNGVAGVIGAVSPIVTAGIRAGADKAIASINAAANVEMTRIQSNTSKYLADLQTELALTQTAAAVYINDRNNFYATQRLQMQLNELRDARRDNFRLEMDRMNEEKRLNLARLDLARQQMNANKEVAMLQLKAQLVAAGLSTGFRTKNSGSSLTVTRVFEGGTNRAIASTSGSLVASTERAVAPKPRYAVSSPAADRVRASLASNGVISGSNKLQRVRVEDGGFESDLASFSRSMEAPHPHAQNRRVQRGVSQAQGHYAGASEGYSRTRPVLR